MSDQQQKENKSDSSQESSIQNVHSPRPPHIPDELLNMVGGKLSVTLGTLKRMVDVFAKVTKRHYAK